jgi:hypothetical protein
MEGGGGEETLAFLIKVLCDPDKEPLEAGSKCAVRGHAGTNVDDAALLAFRGIGQSVLAEFRLNVGHATIALGVSVVAKAVVQMVCDGEVNADLPASCVRFAQSDPSVLPPPLPVVHPAWELRR